ncbi:SRPBCC family protein [uncultured Fibrella sp.]|uniref:SRPBCC family protein n=1 Tax=uncultured Fibrella sp. TaxID=1284596 RepID=UPI0035CA05FB
MNTITNTIAVAALVGVSGFAALTQTGSVPMNVSTNPAAPVACSKQIIINARPDKVWAVLTNINAWADWQTDISKPVLSGPLQPGTTFDWKTGGAGIRSTLHTVAPNHSFGWTGKTFGMYAIHNWTLTEVPGGTQVSVDETMQGLLASLFKKSFNKNLATGMQHWLELLKAEAEK